MGNDVWHVALEPGTTRMQDVIVVNLAINDFEIISFLLSTNHLKGKAVDTERGNYLMIYGGEYKRPYPSVMIWRVEVSEEENTIVNMRHEDGWILKQVWREWLMPEHTDMEYVPPKQFLIMKRK